jgi:hypothetical protein
MMKLTFRIAFVLVLLTFIEVQVSAQQTPIQPLPSQTNSFQSQNIAPCELTLARFPAVRGIKFGMTKTEVENLFGVIFLSNSLSNEDMEMELSNLNFFRVLVNKYPQQLDGIEAIQLRLFQNKVYSISLTFDRSTEWNNIEQFTLSLSENFNLPANWTTTGSSVARMICQDFRVEANTYFLPEVSMTNLNALREIEAKRNEIRNRLKIR